MEKPWYQELHFEQNPLDLRPNPEIVIGLEQEEQQLINHIIKEEICFINGMTGTGKTSLLHRVQQKLKDHSFIYLDAQDLPKQFNLEEELKKRRGFFDYLRFKEFPSKKPVLIIDEFQATDPNLVLEARGKWEHPHEKKIKSIVIAQISAQLYNVTPAFKERLGNRIITLKPLENEQMKEILKQRLLNKKTQVNFYERLHPQAIDLLISCADGNPRRLLEYTDYVFDFHHTKFTKANPMKLPDYKVNVWGVKEILEGRGISTEAYFLTKDKKENSEQKKEVSTEKPFEERYTISQQNILKFLMTGPKTTEEIQQWFNYSRSKTKNVLNELKKEGSILPAGKKDKQRLWQIAPHVKRMTVHV